MITAVTYYVLACDDCGAEFEGTEGYQALFSAPAQARRAVADGHDGWALTGDGRALCSHCRRAGFCTAAGHLWQLPHDARDPVACRRCPARTARPDGRTERPVLLQAPVSPEGGVEALGGDPAPF